METNGKEKSFMVDRLIGPTASNVLVHHAQVKCTPEGRVRPIERYEEANLPTQVLSNIRQAHCNEPTPIERYTLPCIRQHQDIIVCAQTDSGKTAAFLLPILSNLLDYHGNELAERAHPPSPLCLIVSPTRELALQTEREARKFAFQTPIVPCSAVDGHDMSAVSDRLRHGCHILSATTGSLKDLVNKDQISLKKVKYFVVDGADRMLATGFELDIRQLETLGLPPRTGRHTSMFSTTFPEQVQKLAEHCMRDIYIFLAVETLDGANEAMSDIIEIIPEKRKTFRLMQWLKAIQNTERYLIFVEKKLSMDRIRSSLSRVQLENNAMHDSQRKKQCNEAVQQFNQGKYPILLTTPAAARCLNFPRIDCVVYYDLPNMADFDMYRIGRTGRAGQFGRSISFFDPRRESDRSIAPKLVERLTEAGQKIPDFFQPYVGSGGSTFSSSVALNDTRSLGADRNQGQGASLGGNTSADGAPEDMD